MIGALAIKLFLKNKAWPVLKKLAAPLLILAFIYKKGRDAGKKAGEKKIINEHEKVVQKVIEREEVKHAISSKNVADKLNDFFS